MKHAEGDHYKPEETLQDQKVVRPTRLLIYVSVYFGFFKTLRPVKPESFISPNGNLMVALDTSQAASSSHVSHAFFATIEPTIKNI